MVICKKCGGVIPNNSDYCNRCGEPVARRNSNQRQQVFEGSTHKCPNCGENVGSFMARCSRCGHEFRGTNASDSINNFIENINRFDSMAYYPNSFSTYQQKANYIRNYVIPNTKEDIFEFIIMASTNIDYDLNRSTDTSPEISGKREVSLAWQTKLRQAYEKAKLSFGSDPEFGRIQDIYNTDIQRSAKIKKNSFLKKISIILLCVLILSVFIISIKNHRSSRIKEEQEKKIQAEIKEREDKEEAVTTLENTVIEIQKDIDDENYDEAISKANTLIPDSSFTAAEKDKWLKQKKYWLKVISERQAGNTDEIPENYSIAMTESSKDFKGDNYKDVKKRLETAGFYTVRTEELDDIVTGLITSEGEVEKVSINGVTKFKKGDEFTADADVVITYHTKKGD